MKILAIETSDKACSVALLNDNQMIDDHFIAPMQQAKTILNSINNLLSISHVKADQLNAIAFGCGPGSFTGIRIATSVAQGLGYALNIPLIPISSLAALAQSVCENLSWQHLLVAVDARMNEIFFGVYAMDKLGLVKSQNHERLCSPNAVSVDLSASHDWYGIGSGWDIYHDVLTKKIGFSPQKIDATCLPTARAIIPLALEKYQKGEWVRAALAQPIYLRDKVVFSAL